MLSQLRRWGWLFNPITFYFVWDGDSQAAPAARPSGVIVEVTNTPWKERIRYPLVLEQGSGVLTADFDKAMHVSPFLGMGYRYRLTVQDRDDKVSIDVDVKDTDGGSILETKLRLDRRQATRQILSSSIKSERFPTHRVSAGIHNQAMRLWGKGVPVVAHPRKTYPASQPSHLSSKETA